MLIGSKSSLVLIMFGGLLVFYFNMTLIQKLKSLFALIPIAGIVIYTIIHTVLPALMVDIQNFTSVSTRLITSLWAVCSLFYYPLGEGYGTYTAWFVHPLEAAISIGNNLAPFSLNLSEINDMIDTGNYLSAKSGILFQLFIAALWLSFSTLLFLEMLFGTFRRLMQVTTKKYCCG
jgi:hypothetical protein